MKRGVEGGSSDEQIGDGQQAKIPKRQFWGNRSSVFYNQARSAAQNKI